VNNKINNLIEDILQDLYDLDDLTRGKEGVIMDSAVDLYDLRTKLNKQITKEV
tara:strand:- start:9295 stop:9453 length:159 start_codon:yes stop_codon:yes gene_type:complete